MNGPSPAREYVEAGRVGDGFVLHWLNQEWASLAHDPCGKVTMFVQATRQRVRWSIKAHVCGPVGTPWSAASPSGAQTPQETSGLIHYLAWLVGSTTPNVLAAPVCQSATREAISVLQAGLAAAGLAVARAPGAGTQ